ncbi:hypothetical protein L6452_06441 [Arctium lappa]|uniref:Uncharacterized protein n=1 Tax=Arctium lappa TaxID=4217 RepID=A0ACB9EIW3_ARCLA|nr:hypothetical protein L6452_06441 [Arctium lappa]
MLSSSSDDVVEVHQYVTSPGTIYRDTKVRTKVIVDEDSNLTPPSNKKSFEPSTVVAEEEMVEEMHIIPTISTKDMNRLTLLHLNQSPQVLPWRSSLLKLKTTRCPL